MRWTDLTILLNRLKPNWWYVPFIPRRDGRKTMTKTAMIALVSDQPLPNLMAALQYEPRPDHIEFIVSADKEKNDEYDKWYNGKYFALAQALHLLNITCDRLPPVHPYDLQSVQAQCQAAIAKHSEADHIVFNITGGTKMMSLGAFAIAQGRYPIIYVESRDRRVITINDGVTTSTLFDESRFSPITAEVYLTAYQRTITQRQAIENLSQAKIDASRFIVDHLAQVRPILRDLIKAVLNQKSSVAPRHFNFDSMAISQKQFLEPLVELGFLQRSVQTNSYLIPTEELWHFLQGGWLEVYAFWALSISNEFPDVQSNVKLSGSDIELDIVLTRNASLAICEAKVGAKLSITMSRLRALKEILAGVYGKTFYLTASEQITSDMKQAVRDFGVTKAICGPELPNIATIVKSLMQ